jgi:c-di-GMP-binding flagellar brake protein YcgR
MSEDDGMQTERRRSPRVAVRNHRVSVRVSSRVRLLDLSAGGALLSGAVSEPGIRGTLRVPLTSGTLACDVEIRQQQTLVGDAGLESRAGVAFSNLSVAGRRALDRFFAGAKR